MATKRCDLHIHELSGMPNSGKTTTHLYLEKELSRKGFNVVLLNEGAIRSPISKKNTFMFDAWVLADYMKPLLELRNKNPHNTIVVFDRGPLDRHCFHRALHTRGKLNRKELNALNTLNGELLTLIHSTSLLICKPKTAMERDKKHSMNNQGNVINIDFLQLLHQEYSKYTKSPNITTYDSDKLSLNEIKKQILDNVLNALTFT